MNNLWPKKKHLLKQRVIYRLIPLPLQKYVYSSHTKESDFPSLYAQYANGTSLDKIHIKQDS